MIEKEICKLEQLVKELKVSQAVSGSLVKTYFAQKSRDVSKVIQTGPGCLITATVALEPIGNGIAFLSGWVDYVNEGRDHHNYSEFDFQREVDGKIVSTVSIALGVASGDTISVHAYAAGYGTIPCKLSLDVSIS